MNKNTKFSGASKIFFVSPYFLLVFLVIPAYSVLRIKLRLPVSGDLLLGNNVLFCVCIALRLVWRMVRMRGDIRYGADYHPPKSVIEIDRPAAQLQTALTGVGFHFTVAGDYGEKRDLGYLGTTLLYVGLLLLLLFGSYDYMREYSVMGRLGVGEPISLDGKGLIGQFEAGSLAGASRLPLLQVKKQILPNPQWPKGATEIALLSQERKELATGIIAPGKPFLYGGLDYHMTRFIFDALIMIRKDKSIVYENFVKLLPLPQKKGAYSYYGSLKYPQSENVGGSAWLNPEDKAIQIQATLDKKKIVDTELKLWGKNKIAQGEYTASLEGLAQWSEIRVARGRHRVMLIIGAVLAAVGGFIRIMIRPQRIWLEGSEEKCQVRVIGRKTLQLLSDSDKQ
ncbi:cytochrome c biogenesis protein ResB [Geobacter sp. AOG1]|uniref:cytochrome c biogenesis protein ResB n=1 Tax=Geobacter sp. AOG1 TaxID=1566346 RepID=UPI001CC69BD6|nr:cytochrome c biogenesis protein ResB [Geobacter sp. AOG1]GFE57815.1 hypothetical protein AOG1_16950 [Geobacter sp. AOG1]